MSSRVQGKENKGLRIFGRADVPSHKLKGTNYGNNIFFPSMQLHDDMEKGLTIWDKTSLSKELYLIGQRKMEREQV